MADNARRPSRPDLSRRVERRLDDLRTEFALSELSRDRLAQLLLAIAEDAAPTTVHRPADAVDVHIADSLTGLRVDAVRDARTIADLGAGAGLPGLVLAAALPHSTIHPIESVARKAAFIERTAGRMGLGNVRVVAERAEDWVVGIGECDVVCARGLAALSVLVEYAAPLLRLDGTLVAWKGAVDGAEVADADAAAAILGLELQEVRPVAPFAASSRRTLHVYSKVAETPSGYPRRAGIATKRPLTATRQSQSKRPTP